MKTVLLIEDNQDIRENTVEIMEMSGFRVLSEENGRSGIETAIREVPDVILCDIVMPNLSGYEVIKELKCNPLTAHIPFIYLTASGEIAEIQLAMELGAKGYIRKPFDVENLIDTINQCLV